MSDSYEIDDLPEYYTVELECLNCRSYFIDDDPGMYPSMYVIPQEIHIKKGVKISEVECPICGCHTLIRRRIGHNS